MRKSIVLFGFVIFAAVIAFTVIRLVTVQSAVNSQPEIAAQSVVQADTLGGGTDSNPFGAPQVLIPVQYQPRLADAASATAANVATVYFTPQDENTNTTVLFLYNTNPATETVGLQTYYINGSLTISTSVAVPPLGMVRICGDAVGTVSASWQNAIVVNFTTYSAYAKMTLPAGVKADGYVAYDLTGVYDPLTTTQTIPLRFSADPATIFLASVSR